MGLKKALIIIFVSLFPSICQAQGFGNLFPDKAVSIHVNTSSFGQFLPASSNTVQSALNYINAKAVSTSILTSGYVPYTGATTDVNLGARNFLTTGTLGAGAITGTSLKATGLTATRIPFVTTGGLLTDSSKLTWNGNTLGINNASSAISLNISVQPGETGVQIIGGNTALVARGYYGGSFYGDGVGSTALEVVGNSATDYALYSITGKNYMQKYLQNDEYVTTPYYISTVAIGTSPIQVTSTTLNTNLNADLLDGNHASAFQLQLNGTGFVKASGTSISYDNSTYYKSGDTATFANITDSGLTITRVPYASIAGLLIDSANMTFDGTTLTAGGLATTGLTRVGGGTNAVQVVITGNVSQSNDLLQITSDVSPNVISSLMRFTGAFKSGATGYLLSTLELLGMAADPNVSPLCYMIGSRITLNGYGKASAKQTGGTQTMVGRDIVVNRGAATAGTENISGITMDFSGGSLDEGEGASSATFSNTGIIMSNSNAAFADGDTTNLTNIGISVQGFGTNRVAGVLRQGIALTSNGGSIEAKKDYTISTGRGGKFVVGTGLDGEFFSTGDDIYLRNVTQDKDLYLSINDGGVTKTIKWDAANDKLVHSSALFTFNDPITSLGVVTGTYFQTSTAPTANSTGTVAIVAKDTNLLTANAGWMPIKKSDGTTVYIPYWN
jgi:hypothetical protein